MLSLLMFLLLSSGSVMNLYSNLQMLMTSSELTSGVPDFVLKCTSLLLALVMAWFSFGSCETMTRFARYLARVGKKIKI
jgi:hypothetical protein